MTILATLNRADSAEAFFEALGVEYDPSVVRVARLHILRRMGQSLAAENFEGAPEGAIEARCRELLQRAYADFVRSSPIEERVFKVLKDAVAPKTNRPTLVQLGTLE
jgi:nitrogenase-stabilizing/protective protein